jgi:hypothetical protein
MKTLTFTVALLLSTTVHSAQEITIGRTWKIVEPDSMVEAQKAAENIDPERLKPKNTFRERLAAKNILRTVTSKARLFTPSHTVERAVYDRDGNVLYPVGYTYNPIQYMPRFNQRIVVIDERDAEFIKPYLKPSDTVIVNQGDLLAVSEIIGQRANMLDILSAEAMDIKRVPVVITIDYENISYRLEEFNPEIGVPL